MIADSNKNVNRILLTGGGSGGSVSPLLAVYNELKEAYDFLWVGTDFGPERGMVEKEGMDFKDISSGKLRRYFSFDNFFDIFRIIFAFFQSVYIIFKWKPGLVMTAGSFVSVPLVWAAWVLRVKIIIHQQDVRPGLANKLTSPFADIVTVTFEKSLVDYGKKSVLTGNPARELRVEKDILEIKRSWNLKEDLPVLFVMGGGTGAMDINNLVKLSLDKLTEFCQIIHITGKDKEVDVKKNEDYHVFEFLDKNEMAEAYAVSDCIVSRAGMGSLTEIAYLEKPSILIPMPDSHQEENALVFGECEAAVVLAQKQLNEDNFTKEIFDVITDKEKQDKLKVNLRKVMKNEAVKNVVEAVKNTIND